MERHVLCLMGGPALKAGVLKWCRTDTDTKEPKELPEIGYCINEVLDNVINNWNYPTFSSHYPSPVNYVTLTIVRWPFSSYLWRQGFSYGKFDVESEKIRPQV